MFDSIWELAWDIVIGSGKPPVEKRPKLLYGGAIGSLVATFSLFVIAAIAKSIFDAPIIWRVCGSLGLAAFVFFWICFIALIVYELRTRRDLQMRPQPHSPDTDAVPATDINKYKL